MSVSASVRDAGASAAPAPLGQRCGQDPGGAGLDLDDPDGQVRGAGDIGQPAACAVAAGPAHAPGLGDLDGCAAAGQAGWAAGEGEQSVWAEPEPVQAGARTHGAFAAASAANTCMLFGLTVSCSKLPVCGHTHVSSRVTVVEAGFSAIVGPGICALSDAISTCRADQRGIGLLSLGAGRDDDQHPDGERQGVHCSERDGQHEDFSGTVTASTSWPSATMVMVTAIVGRGSKPLVGQHFAVSVASS